MLPNLVTLLRIVAALPCKVSELTSVFDKEDIGSLIPKRRCRRYGQADAHPA